MKIGLSRVFASAAILRIATYFGRRGELVLPIISKEQDRFAKERLAKTPFFFILWGVRPALMTSD